MNLERLCASLYPIIDEASLAGLTGTAGVLRLTIAGLSKRWQPESPSASAAQIRGFAADARTRVSVNPLFATMADIYDRSAAIIEAEIAAGPSPIETARAAEVA